MRHLLLAALLLPACADAFTSRELTDPTSDAHQIHVDSTVALVGDDPGKAYCSGIAVGPRAWATIHHCRHERWRVLSAADRVVRASTVARCWVDTNRRGGDIPDGICLYTLDLGEPEFLTWMVPVAGACGHGATADIVGNMRTDMFRSFFGGITTYRRERPYVGQFVYLQLDSAGIAPRHGTSGAGVVCDGQLGGIHEARLLVDGAADGTTLGLGSLFTGNMVDVVAELGR